MLALLSLAVFAAAPQNAPVAKLDVSPDAGAVTFMSWDTEGGERFEQNLLRADAPFRTAVNVDGSWQEAPAVLRFQCTDAPGGFDLTATPSLALPPGARAIRLVFAFDPAITRVAGRIPGTTRFRPLSSARFRPVLVRPAGTQRGNLAHRQPQAQVSKGLVGSRGIPRLRRYAQFAPRTTRNRPASALWEARVRMVQC